MFLFIVLEISLIILVVVEIVRILMMKRKKTTSPATVKIVGRSRLLVLNATTAPIIHRITDTEEKYIK